MLFLDALVDDFQLGLMIEVGDEVYTINDSDLAFLQESLVDGLVTDDVIDRRKNLREMDLTVKTIRSAWYIEEFVVIETISK
jgi:hypothetical protein